MKYFVTGATGFVGGRLVRQLREAGHRVGALVRNPTQATELKALGVEVHPGDITHKESMRAPLTGIDGVFHCAAWYKIGQRDTRPAEPTNVGGTRNVLELMRELAIPKGVYTSTLAVNSDTHGTLVDESYHFTGTHVTEYDRTKAAAHALAQSMMAQGLPLVMVMPGLIYGPGDTSTVRQMLIQFIKRMLPAVPKETSFSWAHVDDIARAHILAMEQGKVGEKYIVCGSTHTLLEGITLAAKLLGRNAPWPAPSGMFRALVGPFRFLERFVSLPETYSSDAMQVSGGMTYLGDNAKARRDLGYTPRGLSIGLAETLDHELALLGKKR